MGKFKTTAFLIIILGLAFLFRGQLFDFSATVLPQIKHRASEFLVQDVEPEISSPSPLRAKEETPKSFLTERGVIKWTNAQRVQIGALPALTENAKLDTAAAAKVQDMFSKQYFAHVSPEGKDAGDLAKAAGYQAIAIGENLALGNFEDDEALVQAWMDSPGHRENILSTRYQEIGAAVQKGTFEGKTTWLAVQIFGLPLSACTQPDPNLKAQIEAQEQQLEEMQQTLETKRAEIEAMQPKRGPEYSQKVEEYNQLVSEYNALLEDTKNKVTLYNSQVNQTNECISAK